MRLPRVPLASFTAVMGTSILATATHGLAADSPPMRIIAACAWLAAAVLVSVLVVLTLAEVGAGPGRIIEHLRNPASAPFVGALAMGILAFGTATLTVGGTIIGGNLAVAIDKALWVLGTAIGIAGAVAVPWFAFTRHRVAPEAATPVWLLPVVAPMVSAASGALLIDHVSPTTGRLLTLVCLAEFGATLFAALAVLSAVWNRLAHHQHRDPATAPSLLIVLGPLGQSITTAGLLADHGSSQVGIGHEAALAASLLYGIPVLGFATLWLAIAGGILADAIRTGLPFSLGWWAFTFPIGTCVTGTATLATHTGVGALHALTWALWGLLVAGWVAAASGTLRSLAAQALLSLDGRKGPSYTSAV